MQVLWCVSSVLAAIACLSSLLLLWAALDSGNPGSVFTAFGLPRVPYPQVITMMYLKVSSCLQLQCRRKSLRAVPSARVVKCMPVAVRVVISQLAAALDTVYNADGEELRVSTCFSI
jgi:hypothetical protein